MEYQLDGKLDVFLPFFAICVDIPFLCFYRAKIPTLFRRRYLRDWRRSFIRVSLMGLEGIHYTVGLKYDGDNPYMDVNWISFLNCIRDSELKLVLLFRMIDKGVFTVQRFRRDGTVIQKNPVPPEGFVLDPEGTLNINHHSIATNLWGPRGVAPLIPQGPFTEALISDGAPGAAVLYWKGRDDMVRWPVDLITTNRGNVYFDQGWWEFSEYNQLPCRRFCVLTYERNLQFSVLVFHQCCGALQMVYDRCEPSQLFPPVDGSAATTGLLPVEPVLYLYQTYPSYPLVIYPNHGVFFGHHARVLFHRRTPIWVALHRDDGIVWPIELVESNSTRVMRKGYENLRKENGWTAGSVVLLFRVDPATFVFRTPS